ncbi:hypothetical protein [Solimicrobium silvestre]|uniref:Uncharacterized protein n=1 Tax=Solimicrobium silvestre TaxID=2099400 RepID=A0A2S9H0G9_9BURK|nr:hypothetical protein [Solimicrobium silvestre]PRC93453.1 hypothetical protein S2091_1840 [Solimicrobium silvestre]
MTNKDHINRLLPDADGLDFEGLRRHGIELLQGLSGGRWTDYNLHDPGVTLLEMLCYGLTDLVYRTDFNVEDFLTGENGEIDYQQQALYPPQEIFPNQALTDLDYCKLIYDHLPNVEDVWIRSHTEDKAMRGLFTIFIKPQESIFRDKKEEIEHAQQVLRADVTALVSANRNLCRDIHEVKIVNPQEFSLAGDIEIDDSRPRAEIYADIYFRCAKLISSGSQIVRFEEALQQGMKWEEILCGPLTNRGYIDENNFLQDSYDIDVIKLITLVRHIPGVKNVRSLSLINDQGAVYEHLEFDHSDVDYPVLHFIDDTDKILALRLQHGRSVSVDVSQNTDINQSHSPQSQREIQAFGEQVMLYLKKQEFEHEAFRRNRGNIDSIIQLPHGQSRDFAQYLSVGENTPAIYGINHHGVPKSESDAVHARAKQLKAYLYPFEQIMANYLGSLQHVRELYSIDEVVNQSYFSTYLQNAEIPNIQELYVPDANAKEIAQILREQDQFEERRNRVLDTLLAIYGEQFPEKELQRYDYYHQGQFAQSLIRCKIQLLKHLCELSSRRGGAINLQKNWKDNSGAILQKRIQILMGCYQDTNNTSLVAALQDNTKYVSNSRYQDKLHKQIGVPNEIAAEKLILIAKKNGAEAFADFKLPHDSICDAVLQAGVSWDNYRIFKVDEQHGWLCLIVQHEEVWPIILMPLDEISAFTQKMIEVLSSISQQCEGFHLVEHLLLRPRANNTDRQITHDFYCHRVSIILPAFTARFADIPARYWIENMIAEQLPAHIMPEFYWLDFPFLAQFELRYQKWLSQLQVYASANYQGETGDLDSSANGIIEFLKKNRHSQSNRYWI